MMATRVVRRRQVRATSIGVGLLTTHRHLTTAAKASGLTTAGITAIAAALLVMVTVSGMAVIQLVVIRPVIIIIQAADTPAVIRPVVIARAAATPAVIRPGGIRTKSGLRTRFSTFMTSSFPDSVCLLNNVIYIYLYYKKCVLINLSSW